MDKIRYSSDAYIRHAGDETLLWHKRNQACLIIQDAEPLLRYVSFTPIGIDDLYNKNTCPV